jgi:hypothetical protein
MLPSGKTDFRPRLVTRDNKIHYILIKGTIPQEEITIPFLKILARIYFSIIG